MKFSPEKFTRKVMLAAAIAVGVSIAAPPSAIAQFRERGPNRPQRDGAQRGQQPGFDRPGGRPGDRPGGGPDGERSWKDVPQKRRQELLKFVEEHFPRMWVEMSRLREKNADGFRKRMRRILPDIVHMMRVYQHDPQMGSLMIRERQLDMRIRHAAHQFHKSQDPVEKEKLRVEIRELVGKAFDVQLQRRAQEITSLESRLVELKDRLTGQEEVRDEMIRQRSKHLLENKPPRLRGENRPGGNDADELDRRPTPGEPPGDSP